MKTKLASCCEELVKCRQEDGEGLKEALIEPGFKALYTVFCEPGSNFPHLFVYYTCSLRFV